MPLPIVSSYEIKMIMNKLRVGVIGLGVGEQLAKAFDRHPDCELAALCDSNETKLSSVGDRFPGVRRYTAADELIDDSNIQAVAIASFDQDHAKQILRSLNNGLHVVSEKPVCTSFADGMAIRSTLNRNPNLRFSSNTILRMSPRFQALKRSVLAKDLGDIFYAEADYNYGRLHKLTEGWRGSYPNYSVMLGGGVHMVDLLLWLMDSKPVEVTGFGNSISSKMAGSTFLGNDLAVSLMHFNDGSIAKVAANFGCIFPHFHRLIVYGTKASFENGLPSALRYVSRDPAVPPELVTDAYPGMGKGDLIPSFVDAVMGRGKAAVDEQDVFAALSVCFAIDRSIATGQRQVVEYI